MSSDDKTGLLGQQRLDDSGPLYHSQDPFQRIVHKGLLLFVTLLIGVTVCLGIYRASQAERLGGLFFMLAFSLVAFLVILVTIWSLLRSGELRRVDAWLLFTVALVAVVQAIFTNIIVFTNKT